MSEAEIKLFGRKIPLPEEQPAPGQGGVGDSTAAVESLTEGEKDRCKEKADIDVAEMLGGSGEQYQKEPLSSSDLNSCNEGDSKAASENAKAAEEPKPERDHKETETSGEEKVLKKPDKILPCPRCNSMDTKFCYYNNYNVNQPRHFCKNCQRYWTAGGAMRNVPVGAGRRKNKHSASSYRHAMITPDALASVQVDGSDLTHHQDLPCGSNAPKKPLNDNGTLLKFGPDAPLCESVASVLSLGEQKKTSELGFMARGEIMDETSCSSSVTTAKHSENGFQGDEEQNAMHGHRTGVTPLHHLHCFPGPPWPYPWNPGWNNVANAAAAATVVAGGCSPELVPGQENCVLAQMSWTQPPMVTAPAFCAPAFPFPFVPASFWGCMPSWIGGPWNLPLVGNINGLSPSSSTSTNNCSGNGSPTLGKHSRDATSSLGEEKTQKSLWIPKTLRIDDPDAAAKSSIFATLGIKPYEGGMFKAFPSKAGKGQASDATHVLHANPAALSRSQTFQEAT